MASNEQGSPELITWRWRGVELFGVYFPGARIQCHQMATAAHRKRLRQQQRADKHADADPDRHVISAQASSRRLRSVTCVSTCHYVGTRGSTGLCPLRYVYFHVVLIGMRLADLAPFKLAHLFGCRPSGSASFCDGKMYRVNNLWTARPQQMQVTIAVPAIIA